MDRVEKLSLITMERMRSPDFFVEAADKCDLTVSTVLALCMFCHEMGADGLIMDKSNCVKFAKALPGGKWKIL